MKDVRQIIAENLIELRKVNKLTQLELAEKLNYSDKAISKWERGESLPDVEILCQIAELYGVSLDYLVTKDHEEETIEYKISKERANVSKTIITWLYVFSAVLLVVLLTVLLCSRFRVVCFPFFGKSAFPFSVKQISRCWERSPLFRPSKYTCLIYPRFFKSVKMLAILLSDS